MLNASCAQPAQPELVLQRNPIEHSIYQRNDAYDGNDSEIVDEQVDSTSASGHETPADNSIKALENGFANSLNFAETENVCTSCIVDAAQKLKGNAGNIIINLSKTEKEDVNVKSVKKTGDEKNLNDMCDKKIVGKLKRRLRK